MKTITKTDLQELTREINYLLNRSKNTFKLGFRNGFIYFDYADNSKDALFNSATTKRQLYNCMQAFKDGLFFNIDK